jgi:hypothetical protein
VTRKKKVVYFKDWKPKQDTTQLHLHFTKINQDSVSDGWKVERSKIELELEAFQEKSRKTFDQKNPDDRTLVGEVEAEKVTTMFAANIKDNLRRKDGEIGLISKNSNSGVYNQGNNNTSKELPLNQVTVLKNDGKIPIEKLIIKRKFPSIKLKVLKEESYRK